MIAVMLIMGVPASYAATVEKVAGSVQFDQAEFVGETQASSAALDAIHFGESTVEPFQGSWELDAAEIVVNWSRVRFTSAGESPADPSQPLLAGSGEPGGGEEKYSTALASSTIAGETANMMVVSAAGEVAFESQSLGKFIGRSAQDDKWTAGGFSNRTDTTNLSGNPTRFFVDYELGEGAPVMQRYGTLDGVASGNFTLYVWGADVKVTTGDGERTYRSGSWSENATGPGPRGVVRDDYWQFLRIGVADGVLSFQHQAGLAQWTASSVNAATEGTATYFQADAMLASEGFVYEAEQDSLEVEGRVIQRLQATEDDPSALRSDLRAHNATLSVAGTAIPQPAAVAPASWWLAVPILLAGAAAVGILWVRRRRRRLAVTDLVRIQRARDALMAQRPRRALRRARGVLRHFPDDREAWFVVGAGLMRLGRYDQVLARAEELPEAVTQFPPFAFVAGLCHLRLGQREEARRWLAVAARDPVFLQEIRGSPLIEDEPDDAIFRRLLVDAVAPDAAYA